ncbi:hypothetical protein CDAR_565461 [Caerostris darwini]|uniref:Uncharacterized protein n=1 Tax=Caerostris darwini TaxID=1538125 RepID=A0AAV4TWP1_9ARAC|nr:hypothetical protein CDAR_565461 [Caerostris darwini]
MRQSNFQKHRKLSSQPTSILNDNDSALFGLQVFVSVFNLRKCKIQIRFRFQFSSPVELSISINQQTGTLQCSLTFELSHTFREPPRTPKRTENRHKSLGERQN